MAKSEPVEDVESFRLRARSWLSATMPLRPLVDPYDQLSRGDDTVWDRQRVLQRLVWNGGFAGICFPSEYGGLGLTPAHQRAFTEESLPYEIPWCLNVPTFGILAATLIDYGTDEQKARHLPAILKGEELWVQFLSEPTGGSDLAGCLTRADRDGDVWILNGSKIWSSGAYVSDYAMCLARTDWDVPKHRGLTMFIVKIHQPGITIDRIKQVNGSMEFCQEFFDDVALPLNSVVGAVNDGWTVATRLLTHERAAAGGGSPYASGRRELADDATGGGVDLTFFDLVEANAGPSGEHGCQLAAEARILDLVQGHLVRRVTAGMRSGVLSGQSAALLKLFSATKGARKLEIGLSLGGANAVVWPPDDDAEHQGELFLSRQANSLAGGSNEMQRNIISERVLGLPREWTPDREVAFRDLRTNRMPTAPHRS